MALDGIYLHLLKNEISQKVLNGRVEKIHQPTKDELLITFRTLEGGVKLLLSAKADSSRVQLTTQSVENPKKPSMLTMLFRKHLSGARLVDIKQDGLERILTFVFDAKNELGDRVQLNLIVEIMGRYSNIILTDKSNKIIDCVKRIDALKSSVREVLPGLTYVTPPPQNKMNILTDDLASIQNAIDEKSKDMSVSKAASQVLQGVSPIICREIEAGLSLTQLKENIDNPKPTVIYYDNRKDFTFFKVNQYGSIASFKEFDSFSQLVEYYYYEQVHFDRIRQRSNDLFKHLTTMHERAVRKGINRRNELKECADKETYKIYGDLINANLYSLKKGSFYYDLYNLYDDNKPIRVPADATLTPSQNAQKYYKEYRKKQVAESKLYDFIKQADDEASYLDSVIDSLSRAQTDNEIIEIKDELNQSGFLNKRAYKNQKPKKLKPRKFIGNNDFVIYVGRNNIQNDKLTLKTAKNYDMWFHVKDCPGSHVVVEAQKDKPFDDKIIRQCAMLAVVNSKASKSSNVAVDYTIIKNVKKPNGAKPGMVIYDNYNTEYVTPNEEELKELIEIE